MKRISGVALRLNDDGIPDIYLDERGDLAIAHDGEAVGQHMAQRLKTHKGECPLNKNAGVPWLGDVLGKGYNEELATTVIKTVIGRTDGFKSIDSFAVKFNKTKREVEGYDISVKTIYDDVVNL